MSSVDFVNLGLAAVVVWNLVNVMGPILAVVLTAVVTASLNRSANILLCVCMLSGVGWGETRGEEKKKGRITAI